jgi:hypothetical protein
VAQDPQQEEARQWSQVVARAWSDEAFKQRLMAEPSAVLREAGIEVPAGRQVRVVEDTEQVVHLVVPQRPRDLSDEQFDQVAAGHVRIAVYKKPVLQPTD